MITKTSVTHPGFTYRLTGAMVEAALQVQACYGFGVGYSMLQARDGRAVCTLRYYPKGSFDYWCGNRQLKACMSHAPGQAAREHFTIQLAAAEAGAKVNHW